MIRNTPALMLLLIVAASSSLADENEVGSNPNIKCVALKRVVKSTGKIERGIEVRYEPGPGLETKFVHKMWFGTSIEIREQAITACERGRAILECRHDGPEHGSYIGSSKTRDWVLHGPNIQETFSDPLIFGDSAFLQCQARIIELISSSIQQLQ